MTAGGLGYRAMLDSLTTVLRIMTTVWVSGFIHRTRKSAFDNSPWVSYLPFCEQVGSAVHRVYMSMRRS